MIQKELNAGFTTMHNINHEELNKKVCDLFSYNLTELSKVEHVRTNRKTNRKLLNDKRHHIIFKIINADYVYFSDVQTRQENKIWVF